MLEIAPNPVPESGAERCKLATDAALRWFAVYTIARHEKHVLKHLAANEIEAFLPLYRTVHHWKNRCNVELHLPLFPNYLFVHVDRAAFKNVVTVPGVVMLVGRHSEPDPLPDREIESLRCALQTHKIEPYPYLVVGQRVRIKRGPLADLQGVLVRKKNSFRVVITLDLIRQSMTVEVAADEVEPISAQQLIPALHAHSSEVAYRTCF